MKKKEFLEKLLCLLNAFIMHENLIPELIDELSHAGNETKFLSILTTRLKFLLSYGINATVHKEFEPISDGIYSFHLTGQGFNIRILYCFLSNHQPALLMAFHERAGHDATDYTRKIPESIARRKKLEDELL